MSWNNSLGAATSAILRMLQSLQCFGQVFLPEFFNPLCLLSIQPPNAHSLMSPIGTKRTSKSYRRTSAVGGIADMPRTWGNVRTRPISDIGPHLMLQ
jgi:hypothetical protein